MIIYLPDIVSVDEPRQCLRILLKIHSLSMESGRIQKLTKGKCQLCLWFKCLACHGVGYGAS